MNRRHSIALVLLIVLLSGGASWGQSLRRVGFLPLEADQAGDQWLGHLVADVAERAMATNSLADVPEARERTMARRKMGMSFLDAGVRNPAVAAGELDLDYVGRGWARTDGEFAIFDLELIDTATGARVLAQTFRAPINDPVDAGLLMASRASEAIFGEPLLAYATQVVRPMPLRSEVLEAYGRGLTALDAAGGAAAIGELRTQSRELIAASNHLTRAVNGQPALLWPYDALMDASNSIIELDPTVSAAYVNIGIAEAALGDLPGAVAILRQGRRMAEDDATVRIVLANYLLDLAARATVRKQELLDEARASAEEATQLTPDAPGAWIMLGATHFDAARYDAAADAYLKATELDPVDVVARLGCGLSLVRLGLWEDAEPHLTAVVELDPGGPYAERARAELERTALP